MAEQPKKQGPKTPRFKLYEVKGNELSKKGKTCPKCGDGVYLAQHKNRLTCGKCGYMEKVQK